MAENTVHTPASAPAAALGAHLDQNKLLVVCLCAAWCGTCRAMTDTLHDLAHALPNVFFIALDIERDSAMVDELDIDDFPTFAFYQGQRLVYFGITLPQPPVIKRLIENYANVDSESIEAPAQILGLPALWINRDEF